MASDKKNWIGYTHVRGRYYTIRNVRFKKKDAATIISTEERYQIRIEIYEQDYRGGEKKIKIDIRNYQYKRGDWRATIRGIRFGIEYAEAVGLRLLRLAASWKKKKSRAEKKEGREE